MQARTAIATSLAPNSLGRTLLLALRLLP